MNSKKTDMQGSHRRSFLLQATGAAGLMAGLNGSFNILRAAKTDSAGATATTVYGKIKGGAQGKTLAFKGIPYGTSTEGTRFLPPTKPAAWTGVREALALGPASPQVPSMLIPESMAQQPKGDANGTEDCLHLNVWSNSLKGKRPVMVWFHGGGYSAGSSNWEMYNGGNLAAKHDVVVVTVTHRLNVFGYLYLAELGGEKFANASNVGMLDCVAALEWVRDNIGNFGGDPGNVTIFGQSGGGGKVSTLMGLAPARGLFHRAIAQSGSNVMGQPADRATAGAKALMATLNVSSVDELQKLPVQKLLEGMRATRGLNLSPVVDGKTLPAGPFNPVSSPLSGNVPFMVGSTETEITWNAAYKGEPIEEAELIKRVSNAGKIDDAAAKELIRVYRKTRADWKPLQLWNLMGTDLSNFRTGTDAQADRRAMAERQAPVYKYYFQWYSPVRGGVLGSYHTLEIPFIFRTADICESMCGNGKDRYALEDKMSAAWVAFARTGNPNAKGNPTWKPYNLDSRNMAIWNNECRAADDPFKEERLARIAVKANTAAV
ncbi:MAG: carboxylesterase family protein [Bryobacteraceae bacterium]